MNLVLFLHLRYLCLFILTRLFFRTLLHMFPDLRCGSGRPTAPLLARVLVWGRRVGVCPLHMCSTLVDSGGLLAQSRWLGCDVVSLK